MSDLISRQDTVDTIRKQLNDTNALVDVIGWEGVDPTAPMIYLISAISALPSADRPTGEWIMKHDGIIFKRTWGVCSCCGNTLDFAGLNAGRGDANYCPNCGAKMKGGTE